MKCQYCGKEFEPKNMRQKYCSPRCGYEVLKEKSRARYTKKEKPEERICKYCGERFQPKLKKQVFCSCKCQKTVNVKVNAISALIDRFAEKHKLEIRNKSKIINAKKMMFIHGNMRRCPCDGGNPERYCGSKKCMEDIIKNGKCHCNMFHLKKSCDEVK